MNLSTIDWVVVIGFLTVLTAMAIFTNRYTKSVADFLVANRCAGRYLLTLSKSMAGLGAITIIAFFELYYEAGFTAAWWQLIIVGVGALIALSGWVAYRFRQTRAMTMAEFFEIRYSRNFRIFAGILAWVSGIINFGIFPAVGARFFLYFCGFPETVCLFGLSISTYVLLVFILLSVALFFTFMGGQITVVMTDFLQGVFSSILFVVVIILLLYNFSWFRISETVSMAQEGESLIHPFKTQKAEDFNVFFYLIHAFAGFYGFMAWQGAQGYGGCALNAHESRMGNILSTWRVLPMYLFVMLVSICAYVFMHHPAYADRADHVRNIIAGIANPQIQKQMTTSVAMTQFLPVGIVGAVCAMMLSALVSTQDTYLHSWGSILVQDVIMPLRGKKTLTPKQHILLLRLSITGVAFFAFFFSVLFRQTEYIFMFFAISGAIFLGGAGSVVIGGLYWKRGSTAGAWSALITGSVLSLTTIIIRQIHTASPFKGTIMAYIGSRNGMVLSFYAALASILVYVIVSILSRKSDFNLDRMLHRGKYAVAEYAEADFGKKVSFWRRAIGMGSEFNTRDKVIYIATIGWTASWIAVFVVGTIYNFIFDVADESWKRFWYVYIWIHLALAVITTVWYTIGGFIDMKRMFALLGSVKRDDYDDGTVLGHQRKTEHHSD